MKDNTKAVLENIQATYKILSDRIDYLESRIMLLEKVNNYQDKEILELYK